MVLTYLGYGSPDIYVSLGFWSYRGVALSGARDNLYMAKI